MSTMMTLNLKTQIVKAILPDLRSLSGQSPGKSEELTQGSTRTAQQLLYAAVEGVGGSC